MISFIDIVLSSIKKKKTDKKKMLTLLILVWVYSLFFSPKTQRHNFGFVFSLIPIGCVKWFYVFLFLYMFYGFIILNLRVSCTLCYVFYSFPIFSYVHFLVKPLSSHFPCFLKLIFHFFLLINCLFFLFFFQTNQFFYV